MEDGQKLVASGFSIVVCFCGDENVFVSNCRRISKGGEDPKITTRHLSDLAGRYLECLEQRLLLNPKKLLDLWPEVLGHPKAAMTKVLKFESGVLHVSVKNSTLLSLLSTPLEKKRLIIELQRRAPEAGIVDIAFCFG